MRALVKVAAKVGSACAYPKALLHWRPSLVPASESDVPFSPFEVARTEGSMVAVPCCFVYAVVAKVVVGPWLDSDNESSVRNTRAKPGAGTLT